ncbi:hypothetical protein DERP_012007 [Dermatophagoides pteronyssinus]|uniref:Uncharacterized protein n=1 Tax=Dermatophagoides pteronyssinus TaxID=6956 RepID=A0ABQ8IVL0_DERPT|nr:hypothetical protein DERP_012007 [Dermatophagoides pteronyssinus]
MYFCPSRTWRENKNLLPKNSTNELMIISWSVGKGIIKKKIHKICYRLNIVCEWDSNFIYACLANFQMLTL